ncbi:MAG: hypothetical protein QMD22_07225 [archaeon]|nr:hypothetical protein [archaeon]
MMRCEKSDGLIVAMDVGASEWLVTAGRIKHQLCEGVLLWRNQSVNG